MVRFSTRFIISTTLVAGFGGVIMDSDHAWAIVLGTEGRWLHEITAQGALVGIVVAVGLLLWSYCSLFCRYRRSRNIDE